jgi:putative protein-disulfide isomerase
MQITFLFDPLCGWCYGASPALRRIAALGNVKVELLPTGLFSGRGARPLDSGMAGFAWASDQRIAQLTGVAFSQAYHDRILAPGTLRFASGPMTLALTAVGMTAPDQELRALQALQEARYVSGRDTANAEVVAAILVENDMIAAASRLRAMDLDLLAANDARVRKASDDLRAYRISGVPAVILNDGRSRRLLSSELLFGDADGLIAELSAA